MLHPKLVLRRIVSLLLALPCHLPFPLLLVAGGAITVQNMRLSESATKLLLVSKRAKDDSVCLYPYQVMDLLGQSLATLRTEFKDIKNSFNGRYVRLYGACDRKGF